MTDMADIAKAMYYKVMGSKSAADMHNGDHGTPVERREASTYDPKKGTYQGNPVGQGAAQNAVDAIKARKKMLDDL